MTNTDREFTEQIAVLRENRMMTLNELAILMNSSKRTVQRRLPKLNVIRSYNKNGRYFCLKELAEYNQHGIWKCEDVFFSEFGNLKQTLLHIIKNSQAGLDAQEIGRILELNPRSFLSHFSKNDSIEREKINGRYIYFYADENYLKKQKQNRIISLPEMKKTLVSDTLGILILVEYIKLSESDSKALSLILKKQGVSLREKTIFDFLNSHGIEKKADLSQ